MTQRHMNASFSFEFDHDDIKKLARFLDTMPWASCNLALLEALRFADENFSFKMRRTFAQHLYKGEDIKAIVYVYRNQGNTRFVCIREEHRLHFDETIAVISYVSLDCNWKETCGSFVSEADFMTERQRTIFARRIFKGNFGGALNCYHRVIVQRL